MSNTLKQRNCTQTQQLSRRWELNTYYMTDPPNQQHLSKIKTNLTVTTDSHEDLTKMNGKECLVLGHLQTWASTKLTNNFNFKTNSQGETPTWLTLLQPIRFITPKCHGVQTSMYASSPDSPHLHCQFGSKTLNTVNVTWTRRHIAEMNWVTVCPSYFRLKLVQNKQTNKTGGGRLYTVLEVASDNPTYSPPTSFPPCSKAFSYITYQL